MHDGLLQRERNGGLPLDWNTNLNVASVGITIQVTSREQVEILIA